MTRAASYDVVGEDVRVESCAGGPVLVRGAQEVRDAEGNSWPVPRPVVAVCRCRRSERLPWCDSSHRLRPDVGDQSDGGRTNDR